MENIDKKNLPKTIDAIKWFREQIRRLKQIKTIDLTEPKREPEYKKNIIKSSIGRMYTFIYDPKYKEKLPFYDTFPLCIVINLYSDGFLGLNLHYLPPSLRIQLLNALIKTANNNKFDESTKLKINYEILNSAAEFSYFRPCVKRYLYNHIRSEVTFIDPKYWSFTVTLPTENFAKKSKQDVWKISLGRI